MRARMMMTLLSVALLVTFASVASARTFSNESNQASATDNLSGKYEGTGKGEGGEIPLTVELKNDNGKLSGKIDSSMGQFQITSGTYADGKISMKFDAGGNEGTVTATVIGDKISGKFEVAGTTGSIELKKAGMVAAAASASAPSGGSAASPVAGDVVSGDWAASADAQGTAIPFTLKLKLEGDKVTGTSESDQGALPVNKGTYVGGKLSFSLDIPSTGEVTLTGAIKDGKITGEFSLGGQTAGKWEASKKKN